METFLCKDYQDYVARVAESESESSINEIIGYINLKSKKDIDTVFKLIDEEANFIIEFENEEEEKESVLIVGSSITSKIKDGTFKLKSIKEEV